MATPIADEVVNAIDAIVNAYLAHRQDGERFIETYRRLGQAPFREAIYGGH